MEPILAKGMGFLFFALPLATNDSRRLIYAMLYALPVVRRRMLYVYPPKR
jgi:hypothetical protein